MVLPHNPQLCDMRGGRDLLQQQLQGMLTETGLQRCNRQCLSAIAVEAINAEWTADDASLRQPRAEPQSRKRHLRDVSHLPRALPSCRLGALWPRGLPRLPTLPAAAPVPHVPQGHHISN